MKKHLFACTAVLGGFAALACGAAGDETLGIAGATLSGSPEFYTPPPDHGAIEQIADLQGKDKTDVNLLEAMIETPQAVGWFVGGTPKSVRQDATKLMARARNQGVPILIVYNIPFRDCAQYSAGGAKDTAEYRAWIDGLASGLGQDEAVVLLEPDGLGIIPFYQTLDGNTEWCQPKVTDADGNQVQAPGATPEDRFEQLNYAVETIRAQAPNAHVYLDATHSNWLGVGEATSRLLKAGIEKASGFFLNVSNYQFTANSVHYGTWISRCLASVSGPDDPNLGSGAYCANKWWNGGPATGWQGTAMSAFGEWSNGNPELALNTAGMDSWYAGPPPTTRFVIDTSRNGVGPWEPPSDHPAGDPQDWCNPPDRGVGLQPTFDTGNELVDAYVWAKTPGQSDGQCTRWASNTTEDPVRGMEDPPAGIWFPEMALELARNANPPLL